MSTPIDLDMAIKQYATASFTDTTPLLDAGLESLSLLRLAAAVAVADDVEIDAAGLVALRTVGDLKDWLAALQRPGSTSEMSA